MPWPHGRAADPDYASEYAAQRFALYGIAADPTADERTTFYVRTTFYASVNAWQPLGEWSRASDGDGWVASGPLQYSYPPTPPPPPRLPPALRDYTLIGDGYCGPTAGGSDLFHRCQWTSSHHATQTFSLANCQAACDAVADCVAIAFGTSAVRRHCGLQMSGSVSTSTCPTGSSAITTGSTATSCSVVYASSHSGYKCYAVCKDPDLDAPSSAPSPSLSPPPPLPPHSPISPASPRYMRITLSGYAGALLVVNEVRGSLTSLGPGLAPHDEVGPRPVRANAPALDLGRWILHVRGSHPQC